jgi:PsbP
MLHIKTLLSLFLLAFALVGFAQNTPATDLQAYTQKDFTIKYPKIWALDTSKVMGSQVVLFSPIEDANDTFKENVNVMVQDLKGYNLTLKDYAELSEKQITTLVTNGKIYESKVVKTPLGECYQSTYSMEQETVKLKLMCFCYIKNEKAYLITFTALAEKFEAYKNTGVQIMNSFIFPK